MKTRYLIGFSIIFIQLSVFSQTTTHYGSYSGSTESYNAFFGYHSGSSTTGNNNSFFGYYSGDDNTTGKENVFMGSMAGERITTGYRNTFIGYFSGSQSTTTTNNTCIGYAAGSYITTGHSNVFLGAGAGHKSYTGIGNTVTGLYAGYWSSGSYNVLNGYKAGYNADGSNNVFIGDSAGFSNTSGSANIFLGNRAGLNETGSNKLFIDNSDTSSPLIYGEFDSDLITINGKLGIDTTVIPAGYKLAVAGKIIATEVKVDAVPWSDFVFEDEYQLRPLASVKSFIEKNGHLPDIPSENEVAAEGIRLGEMDALLLQKIEELTLYMIQMKEENEALKKELESLKKNNLMISSIK